MDINQFLRHPYKKKRIQNVILDTIYETRRSSTVYLTHVNLPVQMKNVQLPPATKNMQPNVLLIQYFIFRKKCLGKFHLASETGLSCFKRR